MQNVDERRDAVTGKKRLFKEERICGDECFKNAELKDQMRISVEFGSMFLKNLIGTLDDFKELMC